MGSKPKTNLLSRLAANYKSVSRTCSYRDLSSKPRLLPRASILPKKNCACFFYNLYCEALSCLMLLFCVQQLTNSPVIYKLVNLFFLGKEILSINNYNLYWQTVSCIKCKFFKCSIFVKRLSKIQFRHATSKPS